MHDPFSLRADPMQDFGRNIFKAAEAYRQKLREMPREAARKTTEALRGPLARPLTQGERDQAHQAFAANANPDLVRIVDGPALNVIARSAFAKGNPAITIGDTIYIKSSRYKSDLAKSAEDVSLLIHEYFHVMQYRKFGFDAFFMQYGREMHEHGYDPGRLYDYESRRRPFAEETIEGQAEMVGVYAGLRFTNDDTAQRAMQSLIPRLRGSGAYGF